MEKKYILLAVGLVILFAVAVWYFYIREDESDSSIVTPGVPTGGGGTPGGGPAGGTPGGGPTGGGGGTPGGGPTGGGGGGGGGSGPTGGGGGTPGGGGGGPTGGGGGGGGGSGPTGGGGGGGSGPAGGGGGGPTGGQVLEEPAPAPIIELEDPIAENLNNPVAITSDLSYLYVTDTNNSRILRIQKSEPHQVNIMGSGFRGPFGITNDNLFVYVADTGNHLIRRISKVTPFTVTTIAGTIRGRNLDGIGTVARFNTPWGITNDDSYLYVADSDNNIIRRITKIAPFTVDTIAGGIAGLKNADGLNAKFNDPSGMTSDSTYLYVTDLATQSIRRILKEPPFTVTTLGGGTQRGYSDGPGRTSRFSTPIGMRVENDILYIADTGNNRIRTLNTTDATFSVSTLPLDYTKLNEPGGIDMDNEYFYITDKRNSRVVRILRNP